MASSSSTLVTGGSSSPPHAVKRACRHSSPTITVVAGSGSTHGVNRIAAERTIVVATESRGCRSRYARAHADRRRPRATCRLPDEPSVVTVGFFDGVHLGHRAVFARTVETARRARGPLRRGDVRPASARGAHARERATAADHRRTPRVADRGRGHRRAGRPGVHEGVLPDPGGGVRRARPGERRACGARRDRCGTSRSATAPPARSTTCPSWGRRIGLTAEGVELDPGGRTNGLVVVDPRRACRPAISHGRETALGRRFVLDGEVVSGHGRGKGLGLPHGQPPDVAAAPAPGARGSTPAWPSIAGRRYTAAIDVGTNPTFGTEPLHTEAFLLDYDGDDLRGEPLALEFWERLRDEVRYDSVDELVAAIADDVERTRGIVGRRRRGVRGEGPSERPPRPEASGPGLGGGRDAHRR